MKGRQFSRRRFLRNSSAVGAILTSAPLAAQAPRKTILEMARAAERLDGVDIVDAHAHIGDTPADAIWPQQPGELLEDLDRCGIGIAIFSHVGAIFALTPESLVGAHDSSARAVREHPRRLRAYMVFHPHQLETSMKQVKRIIEPGSPFIGLKLHGALHQYPADGPNFRPAFEFARQHRLPVLYHAAGIGDDWPKGVARLADEFTEVPIVLAHFGPGEELLPTLMKGRGNLYIDTCLSTGRFRQVERVVRSIGVEKVLFATDAAFNSAVAGFAKVAMADLPESEKKMVLGGNARRIFGKALPARMNA